MKQYYTRSGKRVLRVQQSLSTCHYRAVSVPIADAERDFSPSAVRTSWAQEYALEADAQRELDARAKFHHLEEYAGGGEKQ